MDKPHHMISVPINPSDRLRAVALLISGSLLFSACAAVSGINVSNEFKDRWYDGDEPPTEEEIESRFRPITPKLILEQARERHNNRVGEVAELMRDDDPPYRVGARDVLHVVVWNHPELTNPVGLTQDIEQVGRVVRQDGTMFFPYVGNIQVAGLTTSQIREEVARRLRPFVERPQVDVRVASFRSQKVYVTGEVREPGILPVTDVPLTIMDAVNMAGGFDELADRRLAVLTRDGRNYPVNIQAVYARGEDNIRLRDGDVLHIQDDIANKVFVMGEVEQQLALRMERGRMTLVEAVAEASGFDLRTANTGAVYVFRGELTGDPDTGEPALIPTVYHLDAREGAALIMADRFELKPRDIVFVSASGLVRFNRVMEQILPTVQFLFQTDRLVFSR